MTTPDLRQRQSLLAGWAGSGAIMLALWLVMAQLSIDRPRQGPPPTELMMNWVRTIIPTPARDQVVRQRVRERLARELDRAAPRPLSAVARPSASRPALDLPSRGGEGRDARALPQLPGRAAGRSPDAGALRPILPGREGWRGEAEAGARRGTTLDLGGAGAAPSRAGRPARPAEGASLRERALGYPPQPLDPVLANFLGCPGGELPGTTLRLAGGAWQAWFCGEGGRLRVLLRQGDELRVLVLAGSGLELQAFQRGAVARARGDLVVQSERARTGDGLGLRDELVEALEERP